MARKLASIVKISKVSPIENADRLEVAEMEGKGWRVVTQKGEFAVGDLAVYFEIDSFLNSEDERYAFLKERCMRRFVTKGGQVLREGIRIKSIKLRGVVSQGLLMPIDKFPEIICRTKSTCPDMIALGAEEGGGCILQPLVGADVTSLLNVEHYDEVKEMLSPMLGNPLNADAMGSFPSLIPKTDEERLTNLMEYFTTMKGRTFEVTEKVDGSSCTCFYSPTIDEANPFGVCTRNLRIKEFKGDGTQSIMWTVARRYGIPEKLKRYYEENGGSEIALQMEFCGTGVQCNRDRLKDNQLKCFRIWDIKNGKFFSTNECRLFCERNGIPHVHVIATDMKFFDEITDYDAAMAFAQGKTANGNEREGIVCKSSDSKPRVTFKIVSNKYLLKNED